MVTENRAAERPLYEFGDFLLDAGGRQLLRRADRTPVSLTPRAFDTLLFLVERRGELADKTALMEAVWPSTIVEENNLTQAISTLRRVLGEARDENRYIATIPGRGYRFVAEVKTISAPESPPVAVAPPAGPRNRRHTVSWLAAVVLVAIASLWMTYSQRGGDPQGVRTIAVLPFKPVVASHRDESLELGMADTLIMQLGSARQISVRPLSSVRRYGSLDQDPLAAGKALDVEAVLDGSIQRSGDMLRISARLMSVPEGKQLWADRFDEPFTDLFTVQDTIAERVANALTVELTSAEHRRVSQRFTEDVEAYQLYITGRFHWNKRTPPSLRKAIPFFERALQSDPNFALAHAALADCHAVLAIFGVEAPNAAFPRARAAALRALEIDPQLAQAHASLGHIKVQYDLDRKGAEESYRRALDLDPDYAMTYHWMGILHGYRGEMDQGVDAMRQALALEPAQPSFATNLGMLLYFAGRDDDAIGLLRHALDMEPGFDAARSWLGRIYLRQGKLDAARTEFAQRRAPAVGSEADVPRLNALTGRRAEAIADATELVERSKRSYVSAYDIATIHASLQDEPQTLAWLARAVDQRDPLLGWLPRDPAFALLRGKPEFQQIVGRIDPSAEHPAAAQPLHPP
jgi:DNA-binding winged helix-turn-helix (wHTH) protein/TolB-like protein/Tfp pilus assembly protein PilF